MHQASTSSTSYNPQPCQVRHPPLSLPQCTSSELQTLCSGMSSCKLTSISPSLQLKIFTHLDGRTYLRLGRTCKAFYNIHLLGPVDLNKQCRVIQDEQNGAAFHDLCLTTVTPLEPSWPLRVGRCPLICSSLLTNFLAS
jgi:hypothetical protein